MLMSRRQTPSARQPSDRTDPALAAETVQRLREDLVVQQPEEIPFGARFGLEVPEYPAIGLLFENADLSSNVELRIRLELLIPGFDEVSVIAGAYSTTAWVPSIVSRTDVPAIEPSRAVGHRSRPLANNGPVLGSSVGS